MIYWIIIIPIALVFIPYSKLKNKKRWNLPKNTFPNQWKVILNKEILFYQNLSNPEKVIFDKKVHEFLLNTKIRGIKTSVSDVDRVVIAASAIIPVFGLTNWRYTNLFEVIVVPKAFDKSLDFDGKPGNILGMVGNGFMEGKMLISKKALHHGFDNDSDKRNTAVHEFVHLIDKMDGNVDGVPEILMTKDSADPWLALIESKIIAICNRKSDINPYGATNYQEFFAVSSEYFFERPKLMKKKHPELYDSLELMFNQEMDEHFEVQKKYDISRNNPCYCNSGKKYKKCCGR